MAVLVTGGKGFLGAALIARLLTNGEQVVCLDLKGTPGRLGGLADRVTILDGGVPDLGRLEDIIRAHGVDRIAHMVFAAATGDLALLHSELATMVMVTADIYEAARVTGVKRVVFPSSIHYYGPQWLHGETPLDEGAPGLATTVYGRGKQLNEAVASAYVAQAGMSIVCLRLPAIYGPGSAIGARAVNLAAVQAARGLPADIPFRPDQRVCMAHVEDVAQCLYTALIAEAPQHLAYNIGGQTVTYDAIAAIVREFVPEAEIRFDLAAPASDLPFLIDDTSARKEFGLRHRPLREGLQGLIEASRETPRIASVQPAGGSR